MFEARAGLNLDRIEVELLDAEQADIGGGIGRQEGLVTDDVEVAQVERHPVRPGPAAA